MIEQVIEVVGSLLGILFLGVGAWIGLITWGAWYSEEFNETNKSKTYITMVVCGLVIYFTFFA
jgi:hypothetical protein